LRFIPQANLTVLDPIWTTAVITYNHAYMVYDKLYGGDGAQIRPQMAAGHGISQDELTWTFTLRRARVPRQGTGSGQGTALPRSVVVQMCGTRGSG
jgi:hypothetical protein